MGERGDVNLLRGEFCSAGRQLLRRAFAPRGVADLSREGS